MKKYISLLGIIACAAGLIPATTHAQSLLTAVSGRIVLDVEQNGEGWYVDPVTRTRFYLGRPDDAYAIMRSEGLGITNADLAKIPTEGSATIGDSALRSRLSGRILLQVESHGEAWYVYPNDLKRYSLGTASQAFSVMSRLGLGISAANLAQIPVASDASVATSMTASNADPTEATHAETSVATDRGTFAIDLITIPKASYEMITDTAESSDCDGGCDAKELAYYVSENGGTIGIHGTYFCPPDYASCATSVNAFDPPVFNSALDVMLNEGDIPYTPGAMVVYDADGGYHFYHRGADIGSLAAFNASNPDARAAIAMYPSLVEEGTNIVASESVSASQQSKSSRGGIGWNDDYVFLVIAHSASVTDLASVFDALGATYAMNLDGGASSAMYFNGRYVYGPTRQIPNAIVFKKL